MSKADDKADDALIARDYIMARLGAAAGSLAAATAAVNEALVLFVEPADDKKGKERDELCDAALEAASAACRALEDAAEHFEDADMEASEPWEDEDHEDGDDEDDEDEDDEEDRPAKGRRR